MRKISYGGKKDVKTFQRSTITLQSRYEICKRSFCVDWKIKETKVGKAKNLAIKIASYHWYRTKNIVNYKAVKFGDKECWKISVRKVLDL